MKSKRTIYKIIIFLFGIWFLLSIFRLYIYAYRAVVDVMFWTPLSIEEKKNKIYGDVYPLVKKIDNVVPKNKTILLITQDGWKFFLIRYLVYPRKTIWIQDQMYKEKLKSSDYIIIKTKNGL